MKLDELQQTIIKAVLKVMLSEKVKFMIRTIIREEIALSNVGNVNNTPVVNKPYPTKQVLEQPNPEQSYEPVVEEYRPPQRRMSEEQKRDEFFRNGRALPTYEPAQLLGMDSRQNIPTELKPKKLQEIYKTKFKMLK